MLISSGALIAVFLLFFLPPIDTDLGWHLRYGEYFLQTGKILKENEFTYFLEDYRWTNPFVLYEIFVAGVYRLGGLTGLSLAYAGLMAIAFWLYSRVAPRLPLVNLVTFLIIIGTSWHVFSLGLRAQIFSFLGIIILFLAIRKVPKTHPLLLVFFFPLLFLAWANTHGGFVLGLAVLGFATIDAVIRRCKPIPPPRWKRSYTPVLLLVSTTSSAAAALINPYGTGIYKEALRHAQYQLDKLIAEWVPPSLESRVFIVVTVLLVAFLVINSRNKQKFFWISAGILFAILTFKSRRFMPYFGIASALAIIATYEDWVLKIEQNLQKYAFPLLGAGSLALFLWTVPRTLKIDTNWKEYCSANQMKQPCRAVEFIRANPIQGQNVFAAYEWGGFLEWQLPEYKYFVDGRMPAWLVSPESRLGRDEGGDTPNNLSPYTYYLEIIQARPGYEEKLDGYGTDWLLIAAGTFLDIKLQSKGKEDRNRVWNPIYRDNLAVIYTKLW